MADVLADQQNVGIAGTMDALARHVKGTPTDGNTVGATTVDLQLAVLPPPVGGQIVTFYFPNYLISRRTDVAGGYSILSAGILGKFDGTTITFDASTGWSQNATGAAVPSPTAAAVDGGGGKVIVRVTGVAAQSWSHRSFGFGQLMYL